MKIKKIDIDGFGVFHQKIIDGFKNGVNILFGENEAGKTTMLDFIRFTLIEYPRTIADRRPPLLGGNHGGRIYLKNQQYSNIEVFRHGNKRNFELNLDGEKFTDESRYQTLINNASGDLYNNIYAISINELTGVGELDQSGMKDRIFSLGMGLSGIDYGDFEKSLMESSLSYFRPSGRTQILSNLTNAIRDKEEIITQLQGKLDSYDQLTSQKEELEKSRDEKQEIVNKLREERNKLRNYLSASETYTKYANADSALKQLGELKPHPIELLDNYKKAVSDLERHEGDINIIKQKLKQAKDNIDKLELNEKLALNQNLLDYLKRNLKSYQEAEISIQQSESNISKAKEKTTNILQKLGDGYELERLLSLKGTIDLQTQATTVNARDVELKRGFDIQSERQSNLKRVFTNLEGKKSELEKQIKGLAIQNDSSRNKSNEKRLDLETEYEKALSINVPRPSNSAKLLLIFSIIFILVGIGVYFLNPFAGIIVVAIAIIGIIVALVKGKSNVSGNMLNTANPRQIKGEIERLESEINAFDQISKELKLVEEDIDENKDELESVEKRLEEIEIEQNEINQNWQKILVDNQLPIGIHPLQMNDVITNINELINLQNDIKTWTEDLSKKRGFINGFKEEIKELIPSEKVSVEEISKTIASLEDTEEKIRSKNLLEKELNDLTGELELVTKSIESVQEIISNSHKELGVEDASAFYMYFEQQEQYREYEKDFRESKSMIQSLCGVNQFEETIEYLLENPKSKIETDLEGVETQYGEANDEYLDLVKELTALETEIKHILEPDELFHHLNDKESLVLQLREATKEWLSTKLALKVLVETKEKYEAEHQPEVIKNTRQYFKIITNGAYTDLRISLSDNDVEIFDELGRSKRVDELSRGTKEQLLLALRLGLIEEYEKSAEPLPVIFDDVMVNFDYGRTRKYAEVITEFAKSRQVIYFTCHDYVKDVFKEQGANIIEW